MSKIFKRTEFLKLQSFENEQKKHGSWIRNRAEQKTEAVIQRLFSICRRLAFRPAMCKP